MDGKKEDIADHFKNIFEELYNSADDKDDLNEVLVDVECKINVANLVEQAAKNLNESKWILSLISEPTELFEQLSVVIQCFLVHDHVTSFLLFATLVPIRKNHSHFSAFNCA